jgi:murein DD-endopeptidase MepM/ murein hydrolase activator NlpD
MMKFERLLPALFMTLLSLLISCRERETKRDPDKVIPEELLKFPAGSFAYPIGAVDYITEKRDDDLWYNAQDFGRNRHLGEDWNQTTGGDTDCGQPVFAAAAGRIVAARDAGPGWGNVLIIEHAADDGTRVQSLYGHLETMTRKDGQVRRRELIGTIGNAAGSYLCHLHFEIRWTGSPAWNEAGPGYSDERYGWVDPSEFIERTRQARP